MGSAERRRGADAERAVVRYLRGRGHEARRYLAGDGRQPGDVDWHPLVCLEVKDWASSSWPSWCRQAVAEAPEGTVPAVVRRTRGIADPGAWECRVDATLWVLVLGRTQPLGPARDVDGRALIVTTLAGLVAAVERHDALDRIGGGS